MKVRTFRTKLWIYFVLFSAMIFTVLWVLQTVFLQSFYNRMLIKNTEKAAQIIILSGGDTDTVDRITHENSLIVFITDKEGNIVYSSDEYKSSYTKKHEGSSQTNENPYRQTNELMSWQEANYRNLPENYHEFLSALGDSESGEVALETEDMYIYGSYLRSGEVLYVGATLDPVGAAAGIIRVQLLWVTAASLVIAFVLAYFISKRFSAPIGEISEQAAKLGGEDYESVHSKGFCRELDELADTLDRSNEKLAEAKTFQQELLANVSHDLRTPLTMIRGYAESIRDFSWEDEKEREEDIEIIIKETDRLTAMVNDVLEYSELSSQGREYAFGRVGISELARRVTAQFEPLFGYEGGTIVKDIAEDLYVKGNSGLLERVVYNLVDNAIRHTGDCKEISVRVEKRNDRVRIEVADKGEGIPSEQIPYIWDRYYTYRQRDRTGTSGLGLAIVKRIVTIHNGGYGVESHEKIGSTFWIELFCE